MNQRTAVRQRIRSVVDWFGRDRMLALWLAVGLMLLSLLGWVFGEITEAVAKGDDLVALDSPVTRWLVAHRTPWLTTVMRTVTELGSAWFVIGLLTVVTVVLVARRVPRSAVLIAPLSAAGAAALITAVKLLIARPRPTIGDVVAVANGFSFPSGHSAQGVATYGALAWVVAYLATRRRTQIAAWLAAIAVALLIGLSRMYLGVHWLSDVIGGYVLATCWLAVTVIAVTTTHRIRARRRGEVPPRDGGQTSSQSTPSRSGT